MQLVRDSMMFSTVVVPNFKLKKAVSLKYHWLENGRKLLYLKSNYSVCRYNDKSWQIRQTWFFQITLQPNESANQYTCSIFCFDKASGMTNYGMAVVGSNISSLDFLRVRDREKGGDCYPGGWKHLVSIDLLSWWWYVLSEIAKKQLLYL